MPRPEDVRDVSDAEADEIGRGASMLADQLLERAELERVPRLAVIYALALVLHHLEVDAPSLLPSKLVRQQIDQSLQNAREAVDLVHLAKRETN